jgi:ubiquinone/menaquinone biosynthesis C-methylase UbiE
MPPTRTDRFYRSQARIYDLTRPLFLLDRAAAAARLDIRPGDRVFDFGCGTGLNVPHLERAGATRITGVDRSREMLARAAARHPQARFVRADAAHVQLGERAERILCTYALSLMRPPDAALRNMHEHLTEDGVLVLLDFHRLRGAFAPLAPLYRRWFRLFGVDTDLDPAPLLRELFREVDVEVRRSGYVALTRARRPR